MSEPYLILHKVRGEPAFDVAIKVEGYVPEWADNQGEEIWIIPTSGHRAYPSRSWELSELVYAGDINQFNTNDRPYYKDDIPADLPDHYACNDRPTDLTEVKARAVDLLKVLNLVKPTKLEDRRF